MDLGTRVYRRIERFATDGRRTAGWVAICLTAAVIVASVAAWLDALLLCLVAFAALGALAIAITRPNSLLYLYCAAVPFNFALPPGPAGTVARIAGVVFFVGYLVRDPGALRLGAVPAAGWLFLGWTLMTVLWAIDPQVSFDSWVSLAQLFGVAVLITSLVARDRGLVPRALWTYSVFATATAAAAIVAYLGGTGIFSRATAFAEQDPALFSSIVLPAAVVLMGAVGDPATRGRVRIAALGGLVICVAALALSGTRSAWAGFAVATVAWFVVRRDWRQSLAVAVVAIAVLIVVAAVPGVSDFLGARVASSLSTGGSGRTDIWAVGLSVLASAPLLGVGFGNFSQAFTPYAISHASASNASGALFAARGAHNVYLGTSVETGLVGGLLLVVLVISAFTMRSTNGITTVVRAALLSLLVQAAFLDILAQKQVWLFLALALGLTAVPASARRIPGRLLPSRGSHGRGAARLRDDRVAG